MPRNLRRQHPSTLEFYDSDISDPVFCDFAGTNAGWSSDAVDLFAVSAPADDEDGLLDDMDAATDDRRLREATASLPVKVRTVKMHVFSIAPDGRDPCDFPSYTVRSSQLVCSARSFDDYICSIRTYLRDADCTYTDFHTWDRELSVVWAKYVDGFNGSDCCFGNHRGRLYPDTLGTALRSIDGNVGYALAVMRKLNRDVQLDLGRACYDRFALHSVGGYTLKDVLTMCRIFRLYIDPYDQSLHVRVQPLSMRRSCGRRGKNRNRPDKYVDVAIEESEGSSLFPILVDQLFAYPAFCARGGPYPVCTTKQLSMRCRSDAPCFVPLAPCEAVHTDSDLCRVKICDGPTRELAVILRESLVEPFAVLEATTPPLVRAPFLHRNPVMPSLAEFIADTNTMCNMCGLFNGDHYPECYISSAAGSHLDFSLGRDADVDFRSLVRAIALVPVINGPLVLVYSAAEDEYEEDQTDCYSVDIYSSDANHGHGGLCAANYCYIRDISVCTPGSRAILNQALCDCYSCACISEEWQYDNRDFSDDDVFHRWSDDDV